MHGNTPRPAGVKIDESLAAQARHIAIHKKMSMADYLSDLVRPGIARDFEAMTRELAEGKDGGGKGEKGEEGGPDERRKDDGKGGDGPAPSARLGGGPNFAPIPGHAAGNPGKPEARRGRRTNGGLGK